MTQRNSSARTRRAATMLAGALAFVAAAQAAPGVKRVDDHLEVVGAPN